MSDLILRISSRLQAEEGQTMVEYGLILALVSVVAIAALTQLGTGIIGTFGTVTGSL